jgi:hypothetical protein
MADINIGRALSGLGAAFKNEMPAFMQQVRQEDLDAEKRAEREMFLSDRSFDRGLAAEDRAMRLAASEATRLAAIDEKRQETLFIDSKIALDALNAGNLNQVYEKFTDRLNVLPSMGVTNLKLSQDVQRLAAGAFENPDDLLNLRRRLEGYVNTGIEYQVLDRPERAKPISVGAGGALFDPETNVQLFSNPAIDKTIEKEVLSLEEEMYRDGIRGQIIGTANEVQMLTQALGSADLNVGERFFADRFGMRGISLAGLGPETEAAQTLINKLAPRMRPKGSGSTSDIEISMYIQSLPAFLQSSEGQQLTNLAFQAAADIEREKISNEEKYTNREMTLNEYLSASSELRRRSIFTDSMRARANSISPGFFDGVAQSRRDSIYIPINSDITLSN